MRRVRRVVAYACTKCFALHPSKKEAAAHYDARHGSTKVKPARKKRVTQTGAILEAVRNGATTAEAIAKATRIPLARVHSLLSYHRRRGNVQGYTGALKVAKSAPAAQ